MIKILLTLFLHSLSNTEIQKDIIDTSKIANMQILESFPEAQEEIESDITKDSDKNRLIIGYDSSENILDIDNEDILLNDNINIKSSKIISYEKLEDWIKLKEEYTKHFDQIIFYHTGYSLESFSINKNEFDKFILCLLYMLKDNGKIIFKSVKLSSNCNDIYSYDINYSKAQLTNNIYKEIVKIYKIDYNYNLAEQFASIMKYYKRLIQDFKLKLNHIYIDKITEDNDKKYAVFNIELEKQ